MSLVDLLQAASVIGAKAARRDRLEYLANNLPWPDFLRLLQTSHNFQQRIDEGIRTNISFAIPPDGSLSDTVSPSLPPLDCIGIDGSQIYPDPRRLVPFSWVEALAFEKITGIIYREAKDISDHLLDCGDNYPLQRDLVDLSRQCLEVTVARKVCESKKGRYVVILDGCMVPWFEHSRKRTRVVNELIQTYFADLDGCRPSLLVSVISNPKSRAVVNLIRLLQATSTAPFLPAKSGIRDRDIVLSLCCDGERTALFECRNGPSTQFSSLSNSLYFFYLRVKNQILRVELPGWVGENQENINLIHSSILVDCAGIQYPYTLAQAHNQVVIREDLANQIRDRADLAYLREGGNFAHISAKTLLKGS
jgi:hypothetical protein